MRRFRSRRPRFRGNFRRARRIVRAVSGISLVKRVLVNGAIIPDVTAADFDNPLNIGLLECTESMDETAISDGSVIADAPLYSRITNIRLMAKVVSGATAIVYRWMVFKSPDADLTASTMVNGSDVFHSSNDSTTAREFRKNTLAKGFLVANTSAGVDTINVRISKAALRRVSPLRENDVLRFAIAKDATGTTATLHMLGSITIRANA